MATVGGGCGARLRVQLGTREKLGLVGQAASGARVVRAAEAQSGRLRARAMFQRLPTPVKKIRRRQMVKASHNKSCLPSREIRVSCMGPVSRNALTLALASFYRSRLDFLSRRLSPSRASPQRDALFTQVVEGHRGYAWVDSILSVAAQARLCAQQNWLPLQHDYHQ
jgi:hypothetical protein